MVSDEVVKGFKVLDYERGIFVTSVLVEEICISFVFWYMARVKNDGITSFDWATGKPLQVT